MPCNVVIRRRLRSYGKLWRVETLTHTRKPSMLVFWKLTNLQGSVWSLIYREIVVITSQRKGFNSLAHNNLVQKLIPLPQAMKIPDAKAAVDKEWDKNEKIPAWQMDKVKSTRRDQESPLCIIDGLNSSQECRVRTAPKRHSNARLPECAEQAAGALSAYAESKWKTLHDCSHSKIRIRLPRRKWPKIVVKH